MEGHVNISDHFDFSNIRLIHFIHLPCLLSYYFINIKEEYIRELV